MRLGAGGRGAGQAGPVGRQLAVGALPSLPAAIREKQYLRKGYHHEKACELGSTSTHAQLLHACVRTRERVLICAKSLTMTIAAAGCGSGTTATSTSSPGATTAQTQAAQGQGHASSAKKTGGTIQLDDSPQPVTPAPASGRGAARMASFPDICLSFPRDLRVPDALLALRDLPASEAVQRDPDAVPQQPQSDSEKQPGGCPDGPGESQEQEGTPAPPEGQPNGAVDGDDGSDSGASNEGLEPERDAENAPGAEPGETEAEATGDTAGRSGGSGATDTAATDDGWARPRNDLASLPEAMADVLGKIAPSAEAMAELGGEGRGGQELEHVRADAEQLARSLSGTRDMVGAVRRSVDAARTRWRAASTTRLPARSPRTTATTASSPSLRAAPVDAGADARQRRPQPRPGVPQEGTVAKRRTRSGFSATCPARCAARR